MEKPPLGLRPKWVTDELRKKEIWDAITRYMKSNKPIPQEWIDEYNDWAEKEDKP